MQSGVNHHAGEETWLGAAAYRSEGGSALYWAKNMTYIESVERWYHDVPWSTIRAEKELTNTQELIVPVDYCKMYHTEDPDNTA